MEVTNDCIRRIEQTEITNNSKLVQIQHHNTQDMMEEIISNRKNQSNNSIDTYTEDAIKNEYYELAEARNAVEYIEHFVKQMKHIIDQNPAKPKDYDKWTDKEQYEHIISNIKIYVPSIPDSLLFFIPAAQYRGDCDRNSTDKPLWLDMEKFQRGQKFARDHITSILLANLLSLFELFAFTDGLKPMIFSRQSHTPYLAFKRYLSTACRIKNWMMDNPWTVGTQAYKDVQTVRRMHRAIRLKLCERDNEEIDTATKIPNPWCPGREAILEDFSSCPYPTVENGCLHLLITPKGLNQADMGATQFAFVGMILLHPNELGIDASDEDLEAFCHTWRGIGYLLGMEDEYNFCRGNLQEIKQRSRDFIDVWVRPYLRQVTPEWEHMLRCVAEGERYYISRFTFKTLLLFVTNLLNIDMPRVRHTLTYFERFYFTLQRFMFRYAMKLRFVRVYINKKVCKTLDKAVEYGQEKHKLLKSRSEKALDKDQ
ncbi:uncharacterized protein [Temnothorax nylanderi]|uniref:uncharacterized protein n=1 Tax=Temnothorax nylanderi TaxID=102681 RepID=UPI003A84B760